MKIIKILLVLLVAVIIDIIVLTNTVYALNKGIIELHSGGKLPQYLKRENFEGNIYWKNMYYINNGNKMPAYSLNKPLETDINKELETVNVQNVVSLKLWRVITKGYPYVEYSKLGCNNEEEAYVATQYAAYCFFNNIDVEKYIGVGEAGKRITNTAKNIIENGKNSQDNRVDSKMNIIPKIDEWKIENMDLYKIYKVSAKANFKKYKVYLTSEDKELEGKIKIVDMNNQKKEEFEANEDFKIIIPINQVKDCGKFDINVLAQVETNPIYFVEKEAKQIQRYAITEIYEEGVGKLNEEFKIIQKERIFEEKRLPQTGC